MMKNNFFLKSFRILSLVFFVALLLNACAQEDFNFSESIQYSGDYKIKSVNRLSYDEMLRKLPEETLSRNLKYSYASADGKSLEEFDIDTTLVKQILFDNNGVSYTIKLISQDTANIEDELYNLTISQNNGATEEKIYKYTLQDGKVVADEDHVEIVYSKSSNANCIKIIFPCEYGNYHDDGSVCIGHGTSSMIMCAGGGPGDTGGDGPGNPPGDGPTTPTGPGGYNPSEGGGGNSSNPNTHCAKIKAQRENTVFQNKIGDLEGKTSLKKETGYIQKNGGDYEYKDNAGATDQNNSLSLPKPETNKYIKGYMHTHVDDFEDSDGNTRTGIKAMSPADVSYFMDMVKNAQDAARPLGEVYAIMVSSSVNYQIRFTGNQYQIKTFTDAQKEELRKLYTKDMKDRIDNQKSLEFGFLYFISENMNLKGVSLYRMNADGTTTEIKLNADKTDTAETTCPN